MTSSTKGIVSLCFSICILFCFVALFQVQSVNCASDILDRVKLLPFCVDLPGNLQVSQVIKITGFISDRTEGTQNSVWLNVILRSGCSKSESPFHLRLQGGNKLTLEGNSFQNGYWGNKINGTIPSPAQGQLLFLLEVRSDGYKVTANGSPLWTLPHRMNYADMSTLQIRGESIMIKKVELIDPAVKDAKRKVQIVYPVALDHVFSNPSFPFYGYFPGGVQVGKAIRIKGIFTELMERKRTKIDLCDDCFNGNSIMLHIDVRFRHHTDRNRVVRNYYRGEWSYQSEERDGPFPFHIGEIFTMIIQVQPDCFNISVNDIPCWTFRHRIPYTQATQMTITGDPINILEVEYFDTHGTVEATSKGNAISDAKGAAARGFLAYHTWIFAILFLPLVHFL